MLHYARDSRVKTEIFLLPLPLFDFDPSLT
jgi:hypothetical protein